MKGEEIPITKNIRVMDKQGNHYGATYPKRAKGLVKQGRARFIDDHTIRLLEEVRPPKTNLKILEDDKMHTEHENRTNGPRPGTTVPAVPVAPSAPPVPVSNDLMVELLKRIDAIVNNTGYINETMHAIRQMAESGEIDDPESYMEGMHKIIASREVTNQKAIELIRDMYENVGNKSNVSGATIAENAVMLGLDINDLISSMEAERALIFTRELLGMSR